MQQTCAVQCMLNESTLNTLPSERIYSLHLPQPGVGPLATFSLSGMLPSRWRALNNTPSSSVTAEPQGFAEFIYLEYPDTQAHLALPPMFPFLELRTATPVPLASPVHLRIYWNQGYRAINDERRDTGYTHAVCVFDLFFHLCSVESHLS